jgi:hypothetical protein
MAQFAWEMEEKIPEKNRSQESVWSKMSLAHRHHFWNVVEWEREYKYPSTNAAPSTNFLEPFSAYHQAYNHILLKKMQEAGVYGADKP